MTKQEGKAAWAAPTFTTLAVNTDTQDDIYANYDGGDGNS
jgi:hypothetical protein